MLLKSARVEPLNVWNAPIRRAIFIQKSAAQQSAFPRQPEDGDLMSDQQLLQGRSQPWKQLDVLMSIEMRGPLSMIAQKFHLGRKLGKQGRLVPRPSAMQ